MPPLAASPAALKVSGFGDAVVAAPVGATRAMPIVVAVLGIGDTPEEQCEAWHDIIAARAFVLCPRGSPHFVVDEPEATEAGTPPVAHDEGETETTEEPKPTPKPAAGDGGGRAHQVGFYPIDVVTLDREVTASLAALKQRFGGHVSDREIVYAGFSRGAFLGASLVAKRASQLTRVILIEGGQSAWQPQSATAFASGGGKRVLFACGTPSCLDEAEPAATMLRAQKIETRVVNGAGEGHGYKKQVKEEIRRSFDWVVEGDAAWP